MIEDLLSELEAVGTVESEGEFTMDRGKAREKMRRFQLADPRSYVLELVQAAALKGASTVRFDIDSRDMKMRFDGRPFTTEDFDDIYGAAFTRRMDPDVLARRQLALGVNSAMALDPSRIVVESGAGGTGARLTLEPEAEDSFEAVETEVVGTTIHVRERFRVSTFVSFFKNLAGTLAEEQLLRARCGYARFAIDLEGKRLDQGLSLSSQEVLDPVEATVGSTTFVCGLDRLHQEVPWVELVKDGVFITRHGLPREEFPMGFRAVVEDRALRKDVSQSDIVRDDAYRAMLLVLSHGVDRVMADVARRMLDGSAPKWTEGELLSRMRGLARSGGLEQLDDPSGLVPVVRQLPLWETTDGKPLSLDACYAEVERSGMLPYVVHERFEGIELPGHPFVVRLPASAFSSPLKEVLAEAFGDDLRDVTGMMKRLHRRERARQQWMSRPTEPRLPEGAYLVRRTFEGPGVQGEVGICAEPTDQAWIYFVVDGCLLTTAKLDLPLLGLRVIVSADAFTPTTNFDRIARSPGAFAALLHFVGMVPELYADLARLDARQLGEPPVPEIPPLDQGFVALSVPGYQPRRHDTYGWWAACGMSYIESALVGEPLSKQLGDALQFSSVNVDKALEEYRGKRLTLALSLDTDSPHPTSTMPLFPTLGSRRHSLRELTERARGGERIPVVEKFEPGIEADILVLSEEQRDTFEPLFPGGFRDGSAEVRRLVLERDFLAKPERETSTLVLPPSVAVPIEGEGIVGRLEVTPLSGHLARRRELEVLHRRRPIDSVDVLLVGRCEGWVESEGLRPKADYSGVVPGPSLDRVRVAVLRAFADACLQVVARYARTPTDEDGAFLREVAALMFPGKALRVAFDRLAREKDVDGPTLGRLYRQLYAGFHGAVDQVQYEQRLWRLSRSKTPVADALAVPGTKADLQWSQTAVDVLFPPGEDPDAIVERARAPVAALDTLPLFVRHDGRSLTIGDMRANVARSRSVLHVGERSDDDLGDRCVVLADAVQLDVLCRILGRSNVLAGAPVIERMRNRAELERRKPVERVALPPGRALVSRRLTGQTTGEVGLERQHPGDPGQLPAMQLILHHRRRLIEEVTLEPRTAHLVASIDDDQLSPKFDHSGIRRDRAFEAMVERCVEQVPPLVADLVGQWERLTSVGRRSAWYHLLDYLVAAAPETLDRWSDPAVVTASFVIASRMAGFTTAGGEPISAERLAKAHVAHGQIEVLPGSANLWGPSPLGPSRPVVCADDYEMMALRRLFPLVSHVESQWARWQARERVRARAPEARRLEDADVLVSQKVASPDLTGWLAIPASEEPLAVELCVDGRVVKRLDEGGWLPCVGSVQGARVRVAEDWSDASLAESGEQRLRSESIELYRQLARWWDEPTQPRRAHLRRMVGGVVVTLRRIERSEELDPPLLELLETLMPLPVLELRDGRRISLQVALEERPDELGHLDLWDATAHRLQQMFDHIIAAEEEPQLDAKAAAIDQATLPSTTMPTPAPPTPEERLADDVRRELSLVRAHNRSLLSSVNLERLRVAKLTGRRKRLVAWADRDGVVVNRDHPVVQRALTHRRADPMWLSYVSSSVFTAINVWLEEVTDGDEIQFLAAMAKRVAEAR